MKKLALGLAVMLALPSGANAAAFINGSFETGPNPGTFTTLTTPSTAIAGWTVGGTIDYIGTYWQPGDGERSIDLNGNSGGSIYQIFDTDIGKTYFVDFLMAGNPAGAPNFKRLTVSATGNAAQTYLFSVAGHSLASMGWTAQRYTFVATSTSTQLTFASGNEGYYGAALDAVSVVAVPEPATWGMMIAGFGLMGAAMRRRSASIRFA